MLARSKATWLFRWLFTFALGWAVLFSVNCGEGNEPSPQATRPDAPIGEAQEAITCTTIQRGSLGNVADTLVRSDDASTNYGAATTLLAGQVPVEGVRYTLLRFDLSPIPAGATVTSATLKLYETGNTGVAAELEAHALTAPFVENAVTWSSFASGFAPTPLVTFSNGGASFVGFLSTTLPTSLVQGWLTGATVNDGIALVPQGATFANAGFASSELAYAYNRPSLAVCYTPPAPAPSLCAGVVCTAADACHLAGTCAPATGECSNPVAPIDDGNPCTVDACDPVAGITHTPMVGCDPALFTGAEPYERHASLLGEVVGVTGTPVTGYTLEVFDDQAGGTPRSDLALTTGSDGSFRARLTSFPMWEPPRSPPHRFVLTITTPTTIPIQRVIYVHPGSAVDLGHVVAVTRDPAITVIGSAGGTATDSKGLMSVVIPPGALASSQPIQITPFTTRDQLPSPLPGTTATTYAFALEPDGLAFSVPVTVRATNYRNAPTSISIPTGTYNRLTDRWDPEGFATWDGSAFAVQLNHFSIHDMNGAVNTNAELGMSNGQNPNNSAQACGAGSSVGYANGYLRQTFTLPGVRRQNHGWGVTLTYNSGLVGLVTPAQMQAYEIAGALSKLIAVPAGGANAHSSCVGGSAGGGGCPSAANSGAGCGSLTGTQLSIDQSGGGVDQTTSAVFAPGATELPVPNVFPLPLDASGNPAAPSFVDHTTTYTAIPAAGKPNSSACLDGNGPAPFGVPPPPSKPGVQTTLEAPPLAVMEQRLLVHQRLTSPFGAGWAINEVSRIYIDTMSDAAELVSGGGDQELFSPRATTTVLSQAPLPNVAQVLARDVVTGEIFRASQLGNIVSLAQDGTPTPVLSNVAFGNYPTSMAVATVNGDRHFVVATPDAILDVDGTSGAVRKLYTKGDTDAQYTWSSVATSGELAFFTDTNLSVPVVYRVRLSDVDPVAEAITSSSPTGDDSLDPAAPASGTKFTAPLGLAVAPDGSLFVADRDRNTIYALAPDPASNGEVDGDSAVVRVIGDGVGGYFIPVGMRKAGVAFVMPQPILLSFAPDGTLWIATPYGAARYDLQATEAEWMTFDNAVTDSELPYTLLQFKGSSILGGDVNTLLDGQPDGNTLQLAFAMSSEYDPTRTLTVDPSTNIATIVDTTAGTIDKFDDAGRLVDSRPRTGEPGMTVQYVDATSDKISTISSPVGVVMTFGYDGTGHLDTITDAANRTTSVYVNTNGDLDNFTEPDGENHAFLYDTHRMTQKQSPRGDLTHYTIDPTTGLVVKSTKPAGEFTTFQPATQQPPVTSATGKALSTGSYTDQHGVSHVITMNRRNFVESDVYTANGVTYTAQTLYPTTLGSGQYTARVNQLFRVSRTLVNGVDAGLAVDYDALGRIIDTRQGWPGGNLVRTLTYDPNGYLQTMSPFAANVVHTIDRFPGGKVQRIWDDIEGTPGKQTTFTWRSDGQLDTMTTRTNVVATFTYDDSQGGTGNLLGASDSTGAMSAFTDYPGTGNPYTANDGTTTWAFGYDADNRLVTKTDAEQNTTTFGYQQMACGCSEASQVTSIHTPDLLPSQQWSMIYGVEGRLASVADPDGNTESYQYEAPGELKQVIDRNNHLTQMTHDALGRVATIVDPLGRAQQLVYPVPTASTTGSSLVGPSLTSASPNASPASMDMGAALVDGQIQLGTNLAQPAGYPAEVELYRDATFQLSHGMTFDTEGRLTARQDRVGLPIASSTVFGPTYAYLQELYGYDVRSEAALVTTVTTNYGAHYDFDKVTYSTPELDLSASNGIETGAVNITTDAPAEADSYGHDPAGRVNAVTQTFTDINQTGYPGIATSYTWAGNGQLTDIGDPSGVTSGEHRTYDDRGLLWTRTVAAGTFTYLYDTMGRNKLLTYPDGHTRVQQFDAEGRLTSRCYTYVAPAASYCYTAKYDPVGNPIQMTDPEGSDVIVYDVLDRIQTLTRSVPGQPDQVESYSYNALGALNVNAGVTIDDQRPVLSGAGTAGAGVPATFNGQPIALDLGGRVTGFAGATFVFDERGRLATTTNVSGTGTLSYGYDAAGRRIGIGDPAEAPGNDNYTSVFYALDPAGNISTDMQWYVSHTPGVQSAWEFAQSWGHMIYDGVDHPLARMNIQVPNPPVTAYYELDLAGNVRHLRASGGADLGGMRYTAFGKLYGSVPPPAGFLGWKGRPTFVTASGVQLIDMRARIWSPDLGVFLSADEFGFVERNNTLWSWPRQNPLRWRDPSGLGIGADYYNWMLHDGGRTADTIMTGSLGIGAAAAGGIIGEAAGALVGGEGLLASLARGLVSGAVAGGVGGMGGEAGRQAVQGCSNPRAMMTAGINGALDGAVTGAVFAGLGAAAEAAVGGGGEGCFVAGTPVDTQDGPKAIEDVQLGDRVGPETTACAALDTKGWAEVALRLSTGTGDDHDELDVHLLRPNRWLVANGVLRGSYIELAIGELQLRGAAYIMDVRPARPLAAGTRCPATGLVRRASRDLVTVALDGGAPLHVTRHHLLFSADRNGWVAAGELHVDEVLRTETSTVKVAGVQKESGGLVQVFNLEVASAHFYFVGEQGVQAHNGCGNPINSHLAGQEHPVTGVPFDADGFPDFEAAGVVEVEVQIEYTGSRSGDFSAANEAAGLDSTPPDMTWHHHQDGTTMQLVPRDIHRATAHTGGFSLWPVE